MTGINELVNLSNQSKPQENGVAASVPSPPVLEVPPTAPLPELQQTTTAPDLAVAATPVSVSPAVSPAIIPDEAAREFLATLHGVKDILTDPDSLTHAIRVIMVGLSEHPHYEEMIEPEDLGLMMRGMRESLGAARILKAANKKGKGSKKKKQNDIAEFMGTDGGLDIASFENMDIGDIGNG